MLAKASHSHHTSLLSSCPVSSDRRVTTGFEPARRLRLFRRLLAVASASEFLTLQPRQVVAAQSHIAHSSRDRGYFDPRPQLRPDRDSGIGSEDVRRETHIRMLPEDLAHDPKRFDAIAFRLSRVTPE